MIMHDWDAVCCGRNRDELPLSDGRTTEPKGVTCDGSFTPAVFAHEVYPHPSDVPLLADAAKYHAARALALANSDIDQPGYMDRTSWMLAERETAFHVAALADGLSGQEALNWVHSHQDDDNELLYDLCVRLGVALERIKPYPLRKREV